MQSSFVRLFESIFPNASYSAERILRMVGQSHQLLVITQEGEVSGFTVASVNKGLSRGEIEFLGVRENRRRQGYGRRLLLSAVDWLIDDAGVPLVSLNVNEENTYALQLYENVGSKLKYTGIGLHKEDLYGDESSSRLS